MEARLVRVALVLATLSSAGASYKTPNFVVEAPTPEIAKQVGTLAEQYRDELAVEWLGRKLPRWYQPCTISVKVGQIGAGGATTFAFDRGHVFGWKMNIQGSLERILDSVLPHEVSHTVFATHFRRPLPRWADEGAATLVETESERRRQTMLLGQVLRDRRHIPLRTLLSMKEYPQGMQSVLTLYAQGYSLADYLVQHGGKTGKARYLQFLETAHRQGWDHALKHYYGVGNVESLEESWNSWVMAGSPPIQSPDGTQVAGVAVESRGTPAADVVIRSQSPGPSSAASESAGSRSAISALESSVNSRETALPLPDLTEGRRRLFNQGWVPVARETQQQERPNAGGQDFGSGEVPNRSDVPQLRIRSGRHELGNASEPPFSP